MARPKPEAQRQLRDKALRTRFRELQTETKDTRNPLTSKEIYQRISMECMHTISAEMVRKVVNGYV